MLVAFQIAVPDDQPLIGVKKAKYKALPQFVNLSPFSSCMSASWSPLLLKMIVSLKSMMALIVIIACSSALIPYVNAVAIRYDSQDKLERRTPGSMGLEKRGHVVSSETIKNKDLPKDSLQRQMPEEKAHFSMPFIHKREQVGQEEVGSLNARSPIPDLNKTYYLIADKDPEVLDDAASIISPQHANHHMLLKEKVFIKRDPTPEPTHYLMPHLMRPGLEYTQSPIREEIAISSMNPNFSSEARMRMNRGKQKLILAGDPMIIKK